MNKPLDEKERVKLEKQIASAARLEVFVKSDTYGLDVAAMIAEIQDEVQNRKHYQPGRGVEAGTVAMDTAYFSGVEDGAAMLVKKIQLRINDGANARQRLNEDAKLKAR